MKKALKSLAFLLPLLPVVAGAWEVSPGGVAFTTTTVLDINAGRNLNGVRFAEDTAAGCALARGGPVAGHAVVLRELRELQLPVLLFARAHNLSVRVGLSASNGQCIVVYVGTCNDPESCVGPPPVNF